MSTADNTDLLLALRLFDGKHFREVQENANYTSPEEGRFGISYQLTKAEIAESSAAVARLLSNPSPPEELLGRLASAFAPDGEDAGPVRATVRLRGPNVPNQMVHALQVMVEVENNRTHRNMSLADAQAAFDEHHGYEGAAKSIWESRKWKSLRDKITASFNPQKGSP